MVSRDAQTEKEILMDLRAFWTQAWALTLANLKSRYRKTWVGFLWVVLNPMIAFTVQAVAFGHFLKIDVHQYLLYLVAGLLPWMFIVQTLEMSATVFVNAGSLIKSILVSPMVFLLAQVIENLVNFIAAFLVLLSIVFAIEGGEVWTLVLLPLPLVSLVLGVFALSWVLATTQIFFRDTRFVVSFGLQICFFLTPIFYSRELIPPQWQWLVIVNPFFHLIAPFQVLIHDFTWSSFGSSLVASYLVSGLLLGCAGWIWQRQKSLVYFYV